jgi:cation transport ATPase
VIRREAKQSTPAEETPDIRLAEPAVEQTEQLVQSGNGLERRERVVSDSAGSEHRERLVHDVGSERQQQLLRMSQLVWLFAAIIEALIAARVVLRFIAANPDNSFASFTYNTSAVFLAPFYGLTGSPAAGGSVLEVPSLIAMAVYAFVAWGIVKVVWVLFGGFETQSITTYDRTRG